MRTIIGKAFRMILRCAPLLWEQIQQGVIMEWIEYHKPVGVNHFFIYLRDNEEENLNIYMFSALNWFIKGKNKPTEEDAHYFSFENLKALDTNELYMMI